MAKNDDFLNSDNRKTEGLSEEIYKHALIDSMKAVVRLNYQSIYVVDFHTKNFLYVSGRKKAMQKPT